MSNLPSHSHFPTEPHENADASLTPAGRGETEVARSPSCESWHFSLCIQGVKLSPGEIKISGFIV